MKKIVLALAVLFSVAMVSCGNKAAEATDSDTMVEESVAVEEVVVEDSVAADSNAAVAETAAVADEAAK